MATISGEGGGVEGVVRRGKKEVEGKRSQGKSKLGRFEVMKEGREEGDERDKKENRSKGGSMMGGEKGKKGDGKGGKEAKMILIWRRRAS